MKSSGSELATVQRTTDLTQAMTVVEVLRDVGLIQKVITEVMKEGTHYGTIPGTGKREKNAQGQWVERGNPTLYKPGAEKLASVFRLAVDPEIEDLSTEDCCRYRVRCKILTQASGTFLGTGVGEASTNEEKWKWRKAQSQVEFDETSPERRRKKVKDFYDQQEGRKKTTETLQVRTNPADLANTALKMAKKRALIDGILTVTAASDIFAQDLEELPEGIIDSLNDAERQADSEPVRMARLKQEDPPKTQTKPAQDPDEMPDDIPDGAAPVVEEPLQGFATKGQIEGLSIALRSKNVGMKAVETYLKAHFNIDQIVDLKASQVQTMAEWIKTLPMPAKP